MLPIPPAARVFILAGAGGSTESDFPTFRGLGSRWSFLGLFWTFMQIELVSQILLCTYRIESKGGWGKELDVAFSARSHGWNLVHVLQDKQRSAMTKPCLNYKLVGALQSVIFVTIQIDLRRDRPFKQSLTKNQVSRNIKSAHFAVG
jgi:hypothetical protein